MSPCSRCNRPTELHINGVAVCPTCAATEPQKGPQPVKPSRKQIQDTLVKNLAKASARAYEASEFFNTVMGDIPSGIVHPDGTQRIHNASREMSAARREMMVAHNRLEGFLSRGIIPEDDENNPKE